eukprot:5316504-Prymnesium_polylepis.1
MVSCWPGPVERSRVCSHMVLSSRDKYVSRMGVRPIRTPIVSIRMGSGGGGSETLPVHLSYHVAKASQRSARRPPSMADSRALTSRVDLQSARA